MIKRNGQPLLSTTCPASRLRIIHQPITSLFNYLKKLLKIFQIPIQIFNDWNYVLLSRLLTVSCLTNPCVWDAHLSCQFSLGYLFFNQPDLDPLSEFSQIFYFATFQFSSSLL